MSERNSFTLIKMPARKPSCDLGAGIATCTPTELCEHPAYLKSLRMLLAESCRAFEEQRSHAIEAIESALALLAADQRLDETIRRRLTTSFEQQIARVRTLEAAVPETQKQALAVLDRLEERIRSRPAVRR